MEKIWFFGDSITKGVGCLKGDPYYDSNKKIFVDIVSDTLGLSYKNYALDGASNEWILHNLLVYSDFMKPHDIVIVSDSLPWGTMMYNKEKDKLVTINDLWIRQNDFLYNNQEEKKIINNFVKLKRKYKDSFSDNFEKQIDSLKTLFKKNGVTLFFWSHKIWFENEGEFETIYTATNGKVEDGHFSYNGHEKMANYILHLIDTNNKNKKII